MRTLKDHIILYDAACPMCCLYTKGFLKAGMLDKNGRLPYQNMPDNFACLVDKKRFVNEIALVHTSSGKVYYGMESLLKIIVHAFPAVAPIGRNRAFIKIADKLYKFISFNRRVIIPSKKDDVQNLPLNPSFRRSYRLAYLIFSLLTSAFILHQYSSRMTAIMPASSFFRELLICAGQLVWQGAAIWFLGREKRWDYLGNLMTVSLAGSLLFSVEMLLGNLFLVQQSIFYLAGFATTVFLMLLEHLRRTPILGLSWRLSAGWVLYRVIVLFILSVLTYAG